HTAYRYSNFLHLLDQFIVTVQGKTAVFSGGFFVASGCRCIGFVIVVEEATEVIFFRRRQIEVEFGFIQNRALGRWRNLINRVVLQQGICPGFVVVRTFGGFVGVNKVQRRAAGIAQTDDGFIQLQFDARGRARLFFRSAQIEIDKGVV